MTDIEQLFNNTWIIRKGIPNEINSDSNTALLKCIKTEIQNIITSLKFYRHNGNDGSRYNKDAIENLDFSISYQFQSLLESVLLSKKFRIEFGRLDPFLEVIQSPEFGGNVTASVLNAIDQFISYGIIYIEDSNKYSSINKIVESLLNCRFTASSVESDEIALQRLLDLLVNVVGSKFGEFISSENLIKCILKCFQISRQPRSTLLLRSFGENSIQKLITSILSRLGRTQSNDMEDSCITLIRIVNFLSLLSFYGFHFIPLNTSKIKDEKKEDILKVIKKTIQLDGLDNGSVFEIRRMGLNLLNIAIESGGKKLDRFPDFLILIQELCINLLLFSLKEPSMLQFTFRCLLSIFSNFRSYTKLQMELCLTVLHIRIANGRANKVDLIPIYIQDFCFSLEQRESALNSLIEICKDPPFICEIFQNYDCNIYCGNVFQAIARTFIDQFKLEHKNQKKSSKSTKALTVFQRLGFSGLMNILKDIYIEMKNSHDSFPNSDDMNDEIKLQIFLLNQKNQKMELSRCCDIFNENPSNFMEIIVELNIFNNEVTPKDLAKFFRYAPNIDYRVLGEYLSKNKEWNHNVRTAYMSTFDFSDKTIVASLREVLGTFKLPGESQQIERILESFSHEFFLQQRINNEGSVLDNPNVNVERTSRIIRIHKDGENELSNIVLSSSDTVFILSYSIIMLNTDLHNSHVKHKMTVDDFIKNNRGINDGSDLPKEFLTSIFEEIRNNGIKLHETHGLAIKQTNRQSSNIDIGIWDTWLKMHSLNKISLDLRDRKITKKVTHISIYDEMLNILVEMGLVDCIITCLENSSDIQMLFKCINGILELVHLCSIFTKNNVINELLIRTYKFINLELSAKSQLILPIFLHIVGITINRWDKDSPWRALFDVLFMLNSLKLFPQKYMEFEELTDNQGKVISSYSNIQYPRLCFATRTKTFGITNGFEYFLELAKTANTSNLEQKESDKTELNSSSKINKNYFSWSEKFIRSSSLNNNNWLSDITNILFRSIEEDDEENIKFSSEPPKIVDSIIQLIVEEDATFPSKYGDETIPTPSEIILSWIIKGSSPYLAISIYSIIINSTVWEAEVLPIITHSNRLLIDSKMINKKIPPISTGGNSWEMFSHYVSSSLKVHDILINGLKSIELEDCRKVIEILMHIVEQFPFSEKCNINSNSNITPSDTAYNVGFENINIEQEILYPDWGPLIITERKKVLNFRKISDPLISIGIIMSIVVINVSDEHNEESNTHSDFLNSDIWEEVFNFFQNNMKRYSIFTSCNRFNNGDNVLHDKNTQDIENSQDFPRLLSRSDFMFAERIITNSLVLLINLSRINHKQKSQKLTSILQLLLQLHPIIFSLHSEKIIATIQVVMCTEKEVKSMKPDELKVCSSFDCFPDENSILLMLGILQRMVYIPPISLLEDSMCEIPEFYPGKLSDPQILVLSSLECIGMWLYNPKYSSVLHDNISLIIQTLITFAIFTPTTLNGRVVFCPRVDEDNCEYNYDANLQAISLIFSLLSVFTNQDSKILITQVVHTLCIAASFGPDAVRNHTMNRIQQTLGSLHFGSFWFIGDPWIWFELIDACFIPLITFNFKFPLYNSSNIEDDNTSLFLAQYFSSNIAKLVLGAEAVYNRQVHSVTIVSKIILTRIDLLLQPLEFHCESSSGMNSTDQSSEGQYINKKFLLLVPVLVIFVNVLVKNTAGNSSVFFSETLKNIILVVLSTKIDASYEQLLTNAVDYFQSIQGENCEVDMVNVFDKVADNNIFGIIKGILNSLVRPTLPEIASEITGVVEDMQAHVSNIG